MDGFLQVLLEKFLQILIFFLIHLSLLLQHIPYLNEVLLIIDILHHQHILLRQLFLLLQTTRDCLLKAQHYMIIQSYIAPLTKPQRKKAHKSSSCLLNFSRIPNNPISFIPRMCFALVSVPGPLEQHGTHHALTHYGPPGDALLGFPLRRTYCLVGASVVINSLYVPGPSPSASATPHQVMPS